MATPLTQRLPSVLFLQLVAAAVLSIPFVFLTSGTIRETASRLQAADGVVAGVESINDTIELSAAVATEATVTSAVIVLAALPPAIADMIAIDIDGSLVIARNNFDGLTAEAGERSYRAAVDAIRVEVDAGRIDHNDAIMALLDVGTAISRDLDSELLSLSEAVGGMTGADQIARNLEVARSAVGMSVLAGDATARWGGIVSPTDPPTEAEITEFIASVALWREAQDSLDMSVSSESPVAQEWATLRDSQSLRSMERVFGDTIASIVTSPPPATPTADTASDSTSGLTPAGLAELEAVNEAVSAFEDVVSSSNRLLTNAVEAVAEANTVVQNDAQSERTRATTLLGASIILMVLVAGGLGALVVRPLHRLGSVASALSRGELDVRAPESGPSELRTTATALNQALGALERAAKRADALAEERPFDERFEETDTGPLSSSIDAAVMRLAVIMSEREALRRQVEHEAAHDGLTGLSNRDSVITQLEGLLRDRRINTLPCALLYLDLDKFKSVNDEYGHHVGDELLRTTADRLRRCLRESDVGGRIGGDEIVVIAPDIGNVTAAVGLAERIRSALSEPLTIDGVSLDPSVSVGVSIADRPDVDADQLIGEADLALYRAKALGRGRVEVCDETLRQQTLEKSELGRHLDRALADDEFELHYQPIIEARSGRLYSIEALIRWRRNGNLVAPDRFIPHAERSGQIVAIDRWVIRAATEQAAMWDDHPRLRGVPISVNLSGRTISDPFIARDFADAVRASCISPARLMVEVTENSVLGDLVAVVRQITRLRDSGARIALDGFGAGHASLAALRSLDIDVLKIDRGFVSHLDVPTDRSLVDLMIRTGHLLDIDVVANGVETIAQQELLEELGVDALQGFLIARPSPPDQFVTVWDSGTAT